eukprot:3939776-Rhodomonas_salina.1
MATWSGRTDTELTCEQFLQKCKQYLDDRGVPTHKHTKWVAGQLRGDAATWWSGFPNPVGGALADLNTSWADFKAGIDVYASPDTEVSTMKLQLQSLDGLRGTDTENTIQKWRAYMLRYNTLPALRNYYSDPALIDKFVECLHGIVKTNLMVNKPATLEAAYQQAMT